MSANTRYRDQVPTDPDCTATAHFTATAWQKRGCTCPEAWQAHLDANERARIAVKQRRASRPPAVDPLIDGSVTAPDFHSPDVPDIPVLGALAGRVLADPRVACRDEDPELFFPVGAGPAATAQAAAAKRVCARCPLEDSCLTVALRHDTAGVWGGTTEDERRDMRRRPPQWAVAG